MAINIKVTNEEIVTVCIQDEAAPVEVMEDVHIIKEVVGVSLTSEPITVESDGEGNVYLT